MDSGLPQAILLSELNDLSAQLQKLLNPESINELGYEVGWSQRQGRLKADCFIKSIITALQRYDYDFSLSDLCDVLCMEKGVDLTTQSLNERFNSKSVELSRQVLEKCIAFRLQSALSITNVNHSLSSVIIEDATLFELPASLSDEFPGFGGDASPAAMKINVALDLQSPQVSIRLKQATDNDQNGLTMGVTKKSLLLRDLGYYKIDELINLSLQGAYYISRLHLSSKPFLADQGEDYLDLESFCGSLKPGQYTQKNIFLGRKQRHSSRLIIYKLPEKVALQRLEKIKFRAFKKGKKLSRRKLQLTQILFFVTNLPAQEYSPQKIYALYKLRWQIEILFKSWKSTLGLNKRKNWSKLKVHRLMTQFYISLAMAILTTKIWRLFKVLAWKRYQVAISEIKSFRILKRLYYLIANQLQLVQQWAPVLLVALEKKAKRRRTANQFDIMNITDICYF